MLSGEFFPAVIIRVCEYQDNCMLNVCWQQTLHISPSLLCSSLVSYLALGLLLIMQFFSFAWDLSHFFQRNSSQQVSVILYLLVNCVNLVICKIKLL